MKFTNLICKNIGNDCLDFSNSKVQGEKLFTNNIKDKSLSVGEKSNVKINKINLNNSEIAIAVKDSSNATISDISINNSTLPFAVFVKKNEYGPAHLKIKNLNISNSNNVYLVDKISTLKIDGKEILGKLDGKNIEGMMYGNLYGKKTRR